MRGHGWPSGSIGRPQNRQAGRPGGDELGGSAGEGQRLAPGHQQSHRPAVERGIEREVEPGRQLVVVLVLVAFVGLLERGGVELLDGDDEPVEVGLPRHAELAGDPRGLDRLDQLEDGGQRAVTGRRQVLQQPLEELTEGLDLLLLALERHDLARAPGLQEEHPLAGWADRPRGEGVHLAEIEAGAGHGRAGRAGVRTDGAPPGSHRSS